jgi:hypothetical protein
MRFLSGQRVSYSFSHALRIPQNVGLPQTNDPPARPPEFCAVAPIACDVCLDFRDPIVGVRTAGQPPLPDGPFAAVPEVAVAKYRNLASDEDDIWLSGQGRDVSSERQPSATQFGAQYRLASCVSGSVAGHSLARRGRRGDKVSEAGRLGAPHGCLEKHGLVAAF